MKFNALTQFGARNAPVGSHADGQGLWLVKSDRGRGKWVLRIFIAGRRREMGLGRWPDVSIAEARQRAADARLQVRSNTDPIDARRALSRKPRWMTLREAIDGCFEARKAELKGDGKAGRWMSPLSVHVLPRLGARPIGDIDQYALKELLDPLWHSKPEAALKALNRVGLAIRHAAALGLAVDIQATAKARILLGKQKHATVHIPSLPYAEAPTFYAELCSAEGVSPLALRFLMLTCARTTEVRLATFDEIRGDQWLLPAARTKTGNERRIPLVKEAQSIIDQCGQHGGEHLFPAYRGQPISDAAMSTYMKRHGYAARPHGFRATFRTWCEETTSADFATKESVLGHAVDAGVVGAYQRSDRYELRRKLMRTWEEFLCA